LVGGIAAIWAPLPDVEGSAGDVAFPGGVRVRMRQAHLLLFAILHLLV
jgi:hypothetical protein